MNCSSRPHPSEAVPPGAAQDDTAKLFQALEQELPGFGELHAVALSSLHEDNEFVGHSFKEILLQHSDLLEREKDAPDERAVLGFTAAGAFSAYAKRDKEIS